MFEYNRRLRACSPLIKVPAQIRRRGKELFVWFSSRGCCFKKSGHCFMCDYGEGVPVSVPDIVHTMEQVKQECEKEETESILLGTLGSILDWEEFSSGKLSLVCSMLRDIPVSVVIFETHYSTISEASCRFLVQELPDKDVVLEAGLESSSAFVREECIGKFVNEDIFLKKVRLAHSFGISVTANVLLGSPFLSVKERDEDTVESVKWCFENGVDSVALFPVNIRPHTLTGFLYEQGMYERPFQREIAEVLHRLPVSCLERIYPSWYGDWTQDSLSPKSCSECQDMWLSVFEGFQEAKTGERRKKLIEEALSRTKRCSCFQEYQKSLQSEGTAEERISAVQRLLNERKY